jgi:hypothetical protein
MNAPTTMKSIFATAAGLRLRCFLRIEVGQALKGHDFSRAARVGIEGGL